MLDAHVCVCTAVHPDVQGVACAHTRAPVFGAGVVCRWALLSAFPLLLL